jgi:sulfur dioxygenase
VILEQLNPNAHKTYLVADEEAGRALLVDPLLEGVDAYMAHLGDLGLELALVADTHLHADHVSGGPELRKRASCDYVMHKLSPVASVTRRVEHGDILTVGDSPIDVLHTPGHSADGMALIIEGRILTGDALLIGAAGRSDLPGGDADEHWHTLHRTLAPFPDSTLFFPGHDRMGRDFSSLGNERRHNPHFEHKDRYTYVRWQDGLRAPVADWVNQVLEVNLLGEAHAGLEPDPDGAEGCEDRPPARTAGNGGEAPKEVSVIHLHGRIERGKNPVLILDVRDEPAFRGPLGHIEGAYHVPRKELEKRLKELGQFKQSEVVAVSRSGGTSLEATTLLSGKGFEDVKSLRGGMIAWRARGYRVDR